MSAWSVHLDRDDHIEIIGDVRTSDAGSLWRTLAHRTRKYVQRLEVDLAKLTSIDAVPIALLLSYRSRVAERGTECVIVNAPAFAASLIDLYDGTAAELPPPPAPGFVERIGRGVAGIGRRAYEPLMFA